MFAGDVAALQRDGVAALTIDPPDGRDPFVHPISADPEAAAEAHVRYVTDLRRGLDVLRSIPEVDPGRLGYVGYSWGGFVGGYLAGLRTPARAYVLTYAGADWVGADPTAADGFTADPAAAVAAAPPGAYLFIAGEDDLLFSRASVTRYARAAAGDVRLELAAGRPRRLLGGAGRGGRGHAPRLARAPPLSTSLRTGGRRLWPSAECGSTFRSGRDRATPTEAPMRTPRLRTVLILVLLVAVLAARGRSREAPARRPAAHAAELQAGAASTTHWCNFVLAGKNATTDGSVLMGYNNDWSPNNYTYLQVVPGDATHYQYVRMLTLGSVPEGGINVKQLGVNFGTATDLDQAVTAADPFVKKGYGGEIWDTILQQCTTAQQAITLLGQMAQTGFTAGAAGSFAIADPERGVGLRAARRPPLGRPARARQRLPRSPEHRRSSARSTSATRRNFRGSADLQSFAQSIGRYSPADGPFDVAWAYDDRAVLQSYYNTNRLWGAFNTVAPSLGLTPDDAVRHASRVRRARPQGHAAGDRRPSAAITTRARASTRPPDYSLMSPHDQTNRPICYSTTDHSEVWQLRSWKPDDIGGVMWVALSRPCSSTYVPFYDSITSVPAAWSGRTAFNEFRDVADSLDRNGTINGLSPLQVLHPAGEEHLRRVRDGLHERAGEHRGHGRRPERRRAHHVSDQLLGAARDAGAEPGAGCRRRCRERDDVV